MGIYEEFSTYDIPGLSHDLVCIIVLFAYLLFLIWYWRRIGRELRAMAGDAEFAEMYAQALEKHAQRSALYLRLYDLLVVADPLNQGERAAIRQRLRASLKEPPVELCLEVLRENDKKKAELDSIEQWAETCWDKHVLNAQQHLTSEQWNQFEIDVGFPYTENTGEMPEMRVQCNVMMTLDCRSDLYEEMMFHVDLIRACGGIHFTREEIDGIMQEGDVFSDFVPQLLKRLNNAGYTVISLHEGDGDSFLFMRTRDIPAVQAILRALHPELTTNAHYLETGRIYGGKRILNAGESYNQPGESLEEEVEQSQAGIQNGLANQSNSSTHPHWTIQIVQYLIGVSILFGLLCAFGFLMFDIIRFLGNAFASLYHNVSFVAWTIATDADCVVSAIPFVVKYAFAGLVLHCFIIVFINWLQREPRAAQQRLRRRGRPASVPLPSSLLVL